LVYTSIHGRNVQVIVEVAGVHPGITEKPFWREMGRNGNGCPAHAI